VLPFSVSYRDELQGKVRIHVQPDQRILVDAPTAIPMPAIKQAVLKRARWICTQRQKLHTANRNALQRQYVSGETHFFLGKRYLLKIRVTQRTEPAVKLHGGRLMISTPTASPVKVKALLEQWYTDHARQTLQRRLAAVSQELQWVHELPEWQLRPMTKQWGSCSPKGRLSLNPLLVKAPRACIDYVIVHELCHLKHHNHSDAYYRLLDRQMPDWRNIKTRLDDLAEQILAW